MIDPVSIHAQTVIIEHMYEIALLAYDHGFFFLGLSDRDCIVAEGAGSGDKNRLCHLCSFNNRKEKKLEVY